MTYFADTLAASASKNSASDNDFGKIVIDHECDKQQDSRNKVIECAKAMYMYGLCVTLKEK